MRWSSVLSTQTEPDVAIGVAVAAIQDQLGGVPADAAAAVSSAEGVKSRDG